MVETNLVEKTVAALETDPVLAQIMDAAYEQFLRFGYRKTTMEDIAKAAGKGKSSLYYYFKNKEEIFQATVWKHSGEVMTITERALEGITSLKEQILTTVRTRCNVMYEKYGKLSVVAAEIPELVLTMPWFREFTMERVESHFCGLFRRFFSEAAQRGEIRNLSEAEVQLFARMFSMASLGMELPLLLKMPANFVDEKMEQLIDQFLQWAEPSAKSCC